MSSFVAYYFHPHILFIILKCYFPHLNSSNTIISLLSSRHDVSFPFLVQTCVLSVPPPPNKWPSSWYKNAALLLSVSSTHLIFHFPSSIHLLIPLFLFSVYLWSHFSSSLSTSDPSFSTLPHAAIPALTLGEARHIPMCELHLQEPACVVAPGQRWHRPAGMRGEQSLGVPLQTHY